MCVRFAVRPPTCCTNNQHTAPSNPSLPNPPTHSEDGNKADAPDFKPYFLPIKDGGKIPRVDYDYHDALKNTWEGLKVMRLLLAWDCCV